MYTIQEHRLQHVRFLPSPHYNERPLELPLRLIVVHCISLPEGQYGTQFIEDLFLGQLDCTAHPSFDNLKNVQVSAHCVIDRHGNVTQYVPFDKRAWHAGHSTYKGVSGCNDFSVGIELEGSVHEPFAPRQYPALAALIKVLQDTYPSLATGDIVGHQHIAPVRKQDPGPYFDWDVLEHLLGKPTRTTHAI